jgi:hypothetical protein
LPVVNRVAGMISGVLILAGICLVLRLWRRNLLPAPFVQPVRSEGPDLSPQRGDPSISTSRFWLEPGIEC